MFDCEEDPDFATCVAFPVMVGKEQLAARRPMNTPTSETMDSVQRDPKGVWNAQLASTRGEARRTPLSPSLD